MLEPTREVRTPLELALFDFEKVIVPIYKNTNNDNTRRIKREKRQMCT